MLYLCWCKFDLMMYIVPVYIELILVNMYDTGGKWTAIQRTFVNFPHLLFIYIFILNLYKIYINTIIVF